jgi:hypothetical protein
VAPNDSQGQPTCELCGPTEPKQQRPFGLFVRSSSHDAPRTKRRSERYSGYALRPGRGARGARGVELRRKSCPLMNVADRPNTPEPAYEFDQRIAW